MLDSSLRDGSATPLVIRLFGPFDVRQNGRPLPPTRTRKEQWLLALLLLRHDTALDRAWLAGTLWPDSDESQALRNLRRSLSDLRRVLGTDAYRLLSPTPRTLRFDVSGAQVDVIAFDAAITREEVSTLQAATALYRGPLLEECREEWIFPERLAREQAYLTALERLARAASAARRYDEAVGYSRRVIAVDPLRESAQCALLEALAAGGDHAAVTQAYRDFRLLLHRDINAEPAAETAALYRHLQTQGRLRRAKSSVLPVLAAPPPRRLPRPLTPLIGRKAERQEVAACLETARLVTLTGIGGIGKTRLAIAVAEEIAEDYVGGVWFVDLAPLSAAALVPYAVAAALNGREEPGRSPLETLSNHLRAEQFLLILDNCEHLIEACARLAGALLEECPRLRILATSRQSLGISGERLWQVPPLSVPLASRLPRQDKETLAGLMEYEAVRLFVERAVWRDAQFRLTPHNAEAVLQICRRLDGIPLAVEFAAARVQGLSPEQIAVRLDDRFKLLTGGSRTVLARQQTLQAAMDWSYHLLTEAEQVLLRRLSVFAGGWTLEAAEAVCSNLGFPISDFGLQNPPPLADHQTAAKPDTIENPKSKIQNGEVLDLLGSLVDKSLVLSEEQEGQGRYRLLETVRQYGLERLAQSAEAAEIQDRRLDFFVRLAEQAERELTGERQAMLLDLFEKEHDNFRAAMQWSVESGKGEKGLRLAGALSGFWHLRGYYSEGRAYLAKLLTASPVSDDTAARAKALMGAATLAYNQGDYAAVRCLCEESLPFQRSLGDKQGIAESLRALGSVARFQGDYAAALSLFGEGLAIRRELGDRQGTASLLHALAMVARAQGNYRAARAHCREALAITQEAGEQDYIAESLCGLGDVDCDEGDYEAARAHFWESLVLMRELDIKGGIATLLHRLATVTCRQGNYDTARALFEESLDILQELGDKPTVADVLSGLATTARKQGDFARARSLSADSLAIQQELGGKAGIAFSLEEFALIAAAQEQAARAARLGAAAENLRAIAGAVRSPAEKADYDAGLGAARSLLGEAAFASAWAEGDLMTPEQAIAAALDVGE